MPITRRAALPLLAFGPAGAALRNRAAAQDLAPGRPITLVVLTAAGPHADQIWADAQNRMAALSTNSSHRQTDAPHAGLLDEEDGAAVSVQAIDDTVQAVRTGKNLPPD